MLYPTGIKNKYSQSPINYKNRGMTLEELINQANKFYLEIDKAVIYKKPTPIGLIDVDYKKGEIKKAYFKEKSTFDYNGIYKGKYIDFEAKESRSKTSFPLSNIHPHQILHLKKVLKHGAIAFFIVNIQGMYFVLKGEDLIEYMSSTDKKSIPISFFNEKCYRINVTIKPILDYLKVIDSIYFKGE